MFGASRIGMFNFHAILATIVWSCDAISYKRKKKKNVLILKKNHQVFIFMMNKCLSQLI